MRDSASIFGCSSLLGKVVGVCCFLPAVAFAGPNDIRLSTLAEGFTTAQSDSSPRPLSQDDLYQARFAALNYQLGVVFSPSVLTPAETLGYNGFVVQAEIVRTGVDTESGGAENYWVLGTEESNPSSTQQTVALRIRKGLPLGFELAGGLAGLSGSRLSAAQGELKWTFNEGFQTVYFMPDIAVRAAISRTMGSADLDNTSFSAGAIVSKPLGVAGEVSVTPYVAYEQLGVYALSQIVDFTPDVSGFQNSVDSRNNDVFRDVFVRGSRLSAGLRVVYTKLVFTAALASSGAVDPNINTLATSAKVSEELGSPINSQLSFQLSLGADF